MYVRVCEKYPRCTLRARRTAAAFTTLFGETLSLNPNLVQLTNWKFSDGVLGNYIALRNASASRRRLHALPDRQLANYEEYDYLMIVEQNFTISTPLISSGEILTKIDALSLSNITVEPLIMFGVLLTFSQSGGVCAVTLLFQCPLV
jgi:hypothetical protein